ncbi:3'-5' exonuclease [Neisseria meningitidis]|uniref:3'-5' exonuclease n=1 Tax=Neisseria meningitidis TaxID=487 RepID=UPI0002A4D09F|nr:3'-5' exonuclease [Neisseria meningitidis]ELK83420.1 exonuclease, DNA polymerase III, epsilon subunit family domain protein [Neisseria meningitidis NM586]
MIVASRWPLLEKVFLRFGMPVAVVDLESTGGNLYEDRVTEVALVKFEQGRVVRHEWLVNPQKPIPQFVVGLTGISDGMVADAPVFAEIAGELFSVLKGCVLVAHNSRFDYTFLKHEFHRVGIGFSSPVLCSVQLSRCLYPQFYKHSLDSIIERLGIVVEDRHRAMADVSALCDYLEYSLSEHGVEAWIRQCFRLMNPKPLPAALPERLREQLYGLPDGMGVLACFDGGGKVNYIGTFERVYSEVSALLDSGKAPFDWCNTEEVRFFPALGSLHAYKIKAELVGRYHSGCYVSAKNLLKTFTTVRFEKGSDGMLNAKTAALKNGVTDNPPTGLFANKKAARRALSSWAETYGLCPAAAGILSDGYIEDEPCPVYVSDRCDKACVRSDEQVLAFAHKLPVLDWGKMHEVEITETDPLTGEKVVLHGMGGALEMDDGLWYFDKDLPDAFKAKFKTDRKNIKEIG